MTMLLALILVVSPVEQSYGPYTRPAHGGDAVVAPAHGGALLAWSEASRIRFALLDSHAQLISEIHELPASTSRAADTAPAVAFDGETFFIAWNERIGESDQTWGILADSAGTPIGTPRPYGWSGLFLLDPALHLVWDGTSYRMWNGRDAFVISRDGTAVSTVASRMPQSVTAANGRLATTDGVTTAWCLHGGCAPFIVTWTIAGIEKGFEPISVTGSRSPVTITPAGDAFALAWLYTDLIAYMTTHGPPHYYLARPDIEFAPGFACDEEDCVLAYSQSNDVHALVFPIDRLPGPEQLTIAASERIERAPRVFVIAPGRFLVTYRSDGADGARMNGRLVTSATPRRRAARSH
jgi:hypothetical protein